MCKKAIYGIIRYTIKLEGPIMSSRSQRNFQNKNSHITAIVVGIILFVLGLYFCFGLADIKTGLIMTVAGAAFIIVGFIMNKFKSKNKESDTQ